MANPKLSIILSARDEMTANIDKARKSLDAIKNSGASARQQLRQLQQNMAELNSVGLGTSSVLTETAEYAGQLADAISDAQRAVNAYANDQFKLQAGVEAMNLGVSAATSFATSLEMLGIKNDEVTEAIKKAQMAISMLNGVQQIANILNKDSALMLRIKQIQLKANAVSTSQDTAATTSNTVALGANAVATKIADSARRKLNTTIAIGKALMGDWTGLVLLGGAALISYSMFADDATNKTEEQANALKRNTSALQDYNSKVGSEIGKVVSKFRALQAQYVSLRKESEKIKFINDNKEAFKQLGIAINNVTDAQKAFVENSDKVVDALVKQAKARAMTAVIEKKWSDFYEDSRNTHHFTSNVKSRSSLQNEADRSALDDYMRIYGTVRQKKQYKKDGLIPDYMQYGAMTYLNRRRDADKETQSSKLEKETANLARAAASLENAASSEIKAAGLDLYSSSGTTKPKPDKKKSALEIAREQLQAIQKEVKDAVNDFNNGLIDKETLKKTVDKANDYFKANNIKTNVGIKFYMEDGFEKVKQNIIHEMPKISITTDLSGKLKDLPDRIKPLKTMRDYSFSAADGVDALGNAVNTLGSAMQNLAKDNEGLAKAAAITQAVGTLALTFAQSMKGTVTPWDWIAGAVAGVATLTSVIAQLQSFESGGIVGGNSYAGDRLLVRANSGEMILNQKQQSNLFDAIDNGNLGNSGFNGTIRVEIEGDKLVGVLNNTNNKRRRQG